MSALPLPKLSERIVQLVIVTLVVWATVFARGTMGPMIETIRVDLKLNDDQLAMILGPAHAIGASIAMIPLGLAIDRYARTRILLGLVLFTIPGVWLNAQATDFTSLFIARLFIGLAGSAPILAAFSLIADLYAPDERGRATGVFVAGEQTGAAAGFALSAYVLSLLGPGEGAWRLAILWTAMPVLVLAALLALRLREPERTGVIERNPPLSAAAAGLWRYRAMVFPLLAARVLVWVADGAAMAWSVPLLQRVYRMPVEQMGAVLSISTLLAGTASPFLAGVMNDVCQRAGGPRRTMYAMAACGALMIPTGIFGVAPNGMMAAVLLTAFLTIGFTISVAAMMIASVAIPNELRGLNLAVAQVVGMILAIGMAPIFVSKVSTWLGGPDKIGEAMAMVCVSASILATVIFFFSARAFAKTAVS